jgi:hypothetical protein
MTVRKGPVRLKAWLDVLQAVVTVLAILAGGAWFLMQRFDKPMLKLQHVVTVRPMDGTSHHWLAVVEVRATNVGKVRIKLPRGTGKVELMRLNPPFPDNVAPEPFYSDWTDKDLILEPGETDQAFIETEDIPDSYKTVQVYSQYQVPSFFKPAWHLFPTTQTKTNQNLYWTLTSTFDLATNTTTSQASNPQ